MSINIDLDVIAAWVSRPGATPAPTAGDPPTRPGDGPWKPGGPSQRPTTDELVAAARQTVIDLNAAVAASRRARGADLDEVA